MTEAANSATNELMVFNAVMFAGSMLCLLLVAAAVMWELFVRRRGRDGSRREGRTAGRQRRARLARSPVLPGGWPPLPNGWPPEEEAA